MVPLAIIQTYASLCVMPGANIVAHEEAVAPEQMMRLYFHTRIAGFGSERDAAIAKPARDLHLAPNHMELPLTAKNHEQLPVVGKRLS
jgi:hypothetical protein